MIGSAHALEATWSSGRSHTACWTGTQKCGQNWRGAKKKGFLTAANITVNILSRNDVGGPQFWVCVINSWPWHRPWLSARSAWGMGKHIPWNARRFHKKRSWGDVNQDGDCSQIDEGRSLNSLSENWLAEGWRKWPVLHSKTRRCCWNNFKLYHCRKRTPKYLVS